MNVDEQPQEHESRLISSTASTPPKTPLWVKAFTIVSIILVVLIAVILTSGGEHSPSRHAQPASTADIHTPPVAHQQGQ